MENALENVLLFVDPRTVYHLKRGLLGKPTIVRVFVRNLEEGEEFIKEIAKNHKGVEFVKRTLEGDLLFKSKSYRQAKAFAEDVVHSVYTKG